MIMLVCFNVFLSVLLIESKLLKQVKNVLVYWNVRNSCSFFKNIFRHWM